MSFFTFSSLKTLGLKHFPELLGRPSADNPDVLVLKSHVNLLCGGLAGAMGQTISYVLLPRAVPFTTGHKFTVNV